MFKNTCLRRAHDLKANVPVYLDKNTQCYFQRTKCGTDLHGLEDSKDGSTSKLTIPLDPIVCLPHGCSLQVTMQLQDIGEARRLHDQLIPLAPIMLALTAATTIWDGVLADSDVRWNLLGVCLDDRTVDEVSDTVRITLLEVKLIQYNNRCRAKKASKPDRGCRQITCSCQRIINSSIDTTMRV